MDSQQSNSFSYIQGPFKENREDEGATMRKLIEEAENFKNGIQKDGADKSSNGEEGANLLAEKASFLKRLDAGVHLAVRKTLHGHMSKVSSLHWATDSRSLVSASQDGKMVVWNAHKAFKLFLIPLRSAWVMSCAFSPSATFVACGGLDNLCSVFSLRSVDGSAWLLRELGGHEAHISCCRFIDDRQLLTASGDRTCILWDLESAKCVRLFRGHTGGVMSLALLPADASSFVTGSCDHSAKLWDVREKNALQTYAGHMAEVNAVEAFPNGQAFVTASDDASCKFFDIRDSTHDLATYREEGLKSAGATSLAFSHSGRLLFSGYDDYNCIIWDAMRVEKAGALVGHDACVSCLGVPADGSAVCTGSWDSLLKVWN